MGAETGIAWTDHTFNPWWGCARVSPGCQHCYAEAMAKRTGNDVWGASADRRRFGEKHWDEPLKWDKAAETAGHRALVFCASMADVFEDRADHKEDRARLFDLISATPHLTWQLLTKRPENVYAMVPFYWHGISWPENVWLGTTVEDQQRADERIPHLLNNFPPVRFLSCEPLLGRVEIPGEVWRQIEWCIIGGESGPGYRALDLDHARNLRDQAQQYGVRVFFKQVGGPRPTSGGDLLDGVLIKDFPK